MDSLKSHRHIRLTIGGCKITDKKIDWMETFVLGESYQTAYAILMKIDEIVRAYSAADGRPPTMEAIVKRQEAFSRDVGRLVLRAVQANLDVSTMDGSRPSGAFPKGKGHPGFGHLLYGLPTEPFVKDSED